MKTALRLLIALTLFFSPSALSQLNSHRVDHGRVPLSPGPVKIDGKLDDPAWSAALVIDLPWEFHPGENIPAPVPTTCRLTYDKRFLYVAFEARDPEPVKIRAHIADRDTVHRNDYVGIIFDPFNDGRRGFNFMVNPLGVQMDATVTDLFGGNESKSSAALAPGEDFSWDAIWDAAGTITSEGYEVEMAIPWSTLRFPRGTGEQTWGIVPFRAYPRDVMHKLRSVPRDPNRNCFFCQTGTVSGLSGMVPGKNLEFDPTLTVHRTDERPLPPSHPLQFGPVHKNLGLSARWGITPNLSLNGASNPDFSQVEADAQQLSINRRFALFFPEKRPFFLESADFFNTPIQAVHSRVFADPSWGLKLTGKEGKNALGFLFLKDRTTNLILPGNTGSEQASIDEENRSGVLRYRRDLGEASALGALATFRQGADYHSHLFGTDGHLRLSDKDTLLFQLLHSDTRYPKSIPSDELQHVQSGQGSLLFLEVQHATREWSSWVDITRISPLFRADAGFLPKVDYRSGEFGVHRFFYGAPKSWFNRIAWAANGEREEKLNGELLNQALSISFEYEGPLQSSVEVTYTKSAEMFDGRRFETSGVFAFYNFRPTGDLTHSLEVDYSKAIDYQGARSGRKVLIAPGFTYNLGRHLYAEFDHTWEKFDLPGSWFYRAELTRLRVVYQFDVRWLVRAILQREMVRRNTEGPDSRTETLSSQYLVSYKVNPQTMLFAGYGDNKEGDNATQRAVRDRTFFIKLGYAWVL